MGKEKSDILNRLSVVYVGEINTELDKALKECIEKFGYKWYAQGYDLDCDHRDIVFEK